MTLIISKIIDDNIYIESDSKVTDSKAVLSDRFCSVLKTAIIHPSICISYAGTIQFAEEALAKCLKFVKEAQKIPNLSPIIEILKDSHLLSCHRVDFLVGFISDGGPKHITMTKGKLGEGPSLMWIGDQKGFYLFEEKHDELINSGKSEKEALQSAFGEVVQSGEIPSVDHFQISVSIDRKICPQQPVFLYNLKIELKNPEKQTINFDEAGQWKDISLGTLEGGASGASYFVSLSPKLHGVAVHFPFEKLGVLFCPQLGFLGDNFKLVQGKSFKDIDGEEFLDLIKKEYGIPMRGLIKKDDSAIQFIDNRDL